MCAYTHTHSHAQTTLYLEDVGEVATQADDEHRRVQVLREPMKRGNKYTAVCRIHTHMYTHEHAYAHTHTLGIRGVHACT
jgi:hypothetical protein